MIDRPTILGRAYQLARAGSSINAIQVQLECEGYEFIRSQLSARHVRQDLQRLKREFDASRDSPVEE